MLGYFIFAILLVGTSAQASCRCAAMVTADTGQFVLYELPPFDVPDCGQDNFCQRVCNDEFAVQTADGDLNFVSANGETVGQTFCNTATGNVIDSQYVYSYYNLCDTMWQWAGAQSQQPLCCDASGTYSECP